MSTPRLPSPTELTALLDAALQALWQESTPCEQREDVLTRTLAKNLQSGWTSNDFASEIIISHTYGRSAIPDSFGKLRKEIECSIRRERRRKHVFPDIILHQAGNQDNNFLVLEAKKSSNRNTAEREKDVETLSALVGKRALFRYRYGCWVEIDDASARAVWFVGNAATAVEGLASFFAKGQAPCGDRLVKTVDSGTYRLHCADEVHLQTLLGFVAKIDPAPVVVHTPVSACLACRLGADWERDEESSDPLRLYPKSLFAREIRPPEQRRTCMLMVTHACNLNCVYCYEKFKDGAMMDFATAKRAILTEAQYVKDHPEEFKELEIDFMGGEPLMNMPLIKAVVEWLENEKPIDVPYICFATTNGTLVREHANWIARHTKTLCLGLSYDGHSMQRANRGEQTATIPLAKCHAWWPFQGFHMTISKASIQTFGDDILYMHRRYPDWHLNAALAQGVDWDDADVKAYKEQLDKVAAYYLNPRTRKGIVPVNLLTRNLGAIAAVNQSEPQKKFCGSGSGMITYDVDGRTYGCHMFTPIVMGEAKAKELRHCDFTDAQMALEDPVCSRCFLKNYCPTCLGFNYQFRGDVRTRDKRQCKMYLAELRAACEFQLRYFAKRPLASPKDASLLKGALEAYPLLKRVATDTPPFTLTHEN